MKHFKTLVITFLVTFGVMNFVQAQKVAHINFEEVISLMPETSKLQADLEKLGKTYGEEISTAQKALKEKIDKYTAEEISQTAAQNEARIKEVQTDQSKIQQLQQVAQQELQMKEKTALEPIIKKAQEAIEAIAETKGIVYVLDAKALVVSKGEDLLPAVKTSLGIK